MSTPKYRPYFTLPELEELISALKASPNPRRLQIARYLEGFILQIKLGVRKENHTLQPSLEQKLGFDEGVPLSHAITGEAAYNKWITVPQSCSIKEIEEAMTWGYTNDKLTPEQEREFEESQGF